MSIRRIGGAAAATCACGVLLACGSLGGGKHADATASAGPPSGSDAAIVEELSQRTLAYFLENAHPVTGIVRDRARAFGDTPDDDVYSRGSVAATGFGMAVVEHAASVGRLTQARADDLVRRALTTADQQMQTHAGWFYHFVDWATGERFPYSEVSTVDTAWFIAGALYAADMSGDAGIKALATKIYRQLSFTDVRTDGGARPNGLLLTMGWTPESGYLAAQWNSYAEHLLLILLGIGHPVDPLPVESWCAFARPRSEIPGGATLIARDLPLFVHHYSQLFVDFSGLHDPGGDLEANSVAASSYNQEVCAGRSEQTYRAGYWGVSASDGPDGYSGFSPSYINGTVCLGCAGAAAMFHQDGLLDDLATWAHGPDSAKIYGQYGFVDGFNLDRQWFDTDTLGITAGPLYLSLANMTPETGMTRRFTALPEVAAALTAADTACNPTQTDED